ncbi:Astacin, partial [Diplonema papillatum]
MMREFVAVLLGAACFADEKMKLGPLGALYVLDGDVQVPVDEHRHGDALGAFSWLDTKRFLWPGGKMRYVIATDFTDPGLPADHYLTEDDENINWALQHISNNTCVEFIKCDSFDTCQSPFVCFQSSTGCNSHVGMLSWEKRFQAINLSPACGPGAVTHEIFHALGFQHTGMRSDRDEYLSIDYEAGTPPTTEPYGRIINPFDYKSIMHTVESGLSPGDVDSLHFIYNECSEVFTAPTCRSSKNDTIVHVVSAHDGQVPYFFVEFNAEWELGGTMTVSYSRSTGPVGADVPEGGLVKDSARTRVSVSLLDVKHSDTIIVAATFTANTLEAPSTTCQVSIQVK